MSNKNYFEIGQQCAKNAIDFIAGVTSVLSDFMGDVVAEAELEGRISGCEGCWCNTCANLHDCPLAEDSPEEPTIRPSVCIGCKAGERKMPKEAEPSCVLYEQDTGD